MGDQQRFDGFDISLYGGKFQGGFDMDEEFANDLRFDDSVTFIVTGRIGGVSLKDTKLGDLKRENIFTVISSVALDPETASKVLNSLGTIVDGVNGGQLKLGQEAPTASLDDTAGSMPAPVGVPVDDDVLAKFLQDQ